MNFHPSEALPAGAAQVGEAQLNLQADAYGTQLFNPSDSLNLTSVAGSPATGAEAALTQPAFMPGAETALAQPGLMPGADALAGVIAGANEPISPIIQLILRMPGAMGLISSFFEFFSNFFMNPASLFNIFDPAFLGHQAASIFSFTTNHIPLFSQGLTNLNGPLMGNDLLSSRLNLALGQGNGLSAGTGALTRAPLTVSGTTNLSKPLFDGSTGTTGTLGADAQSGVLAGPGLSDAGTGGHLAASNRLFSDQIGGSSFRSVPGVSGQSQPVAGLTGNTPSIQASGSGYSNLPGGYNGDFSANHVGSEQASFRSVDSATNSARSEFGPSGCVGDQLGAGNNQELLALEQPSRSFTPTVGADSGTAGGEMVGLRAKQLSLDSVKADPRPGIADQSQSLSRAAAPKASASHSTVNSTGHSAPHKAPAPAHKPAHSHHKVEHKVEHKSESSQAAETASEVPETDGSMIAEAQAPGATVTYTVQKGDCLWNIAREHMGEGLKWQDLYKLNQDVLGANPDLIYPGTTIQIPGQGAEIASSGSVDYVVQPGDNLWNISKDHLGQGHMWGDIYHLNQDVIGANPSLIHPGQHLSLPGNNDPSSMALSNQVNTADPQSMTSTPAAEPAVDATAGGAGQAAPAPAGEPTATNYYGQGSSFQPLESSALPDANQTTFTPTVGAGSGTSPVSQAALPVIPANSLPVAAGPGAAQAATLNTGKSAVVNSGLLGDLKSFINEGKR